MCACFAIELLDIVCAGVEQVTMVCLLITGRESTEDQNMFVRNLVKTATFQAYPIGILFDPKVQGLPMLSPLNVVLFDKICSLTAVESCYNIQSLIVKGDCSVEIASGV